MSLFAVTRHAGPAWIDGKGAFEQPARVGIEDPEHSLVDVAVTLPVRDDGEKSPRQVQRHVRRIIRYVLEPRQVPQPERCIPQVPL